jgi:hypothetical protein
MLSALLVHFLPAPTTLVYLVLAGIFVVQALGVALMRETATRSPGALASLRPQLATSPATRRPLALAAPMLVALWSLGGFYASLGPALARDVVGSRSILLGGVLLTALSGVAAATVLVVRQVDAQRTMLVGAAALFTGVGVTLLATALGSTPLFFTGAVIAGIGFGGGFQGSLRVVLPLTGPHDRAGVLSVVYAVSYLALGLPAVLGGIATVHVGLVDAARWYGAGVMALSAVTLIGLALQRRRGSATA